jgi:hypothetical protein
MACTPHFDSAGLGGWWADDYGKRICTWTYDTVSREIAVACGPTGKKVQLPAGLAGDELKQRIASTALGLAEKIKGKRFDTN